ncbi:39294_t:CDS:2, partial [Gigaspora margarita]
MSNIIKRSRNSYTIKQKKEVVAYAKEYGRNEAARNFTLDSSMVGRWVTASANWIDEVNQNSKSSGSGRKAFYLEAEKRLYEWIIEQRKKGLAVTYIIIRIKMMEILKDQDISVTLLLDFKASNRWIHGFMKRNQLALRRRTKVSQKLPEQTEELLSSQRLPSKEQVPPGIIVWFQENGWMNTSLMTKYVDYLESTRNNEYKAPTMMVYDSFRGHLEDSIKKKFSKNGYDLAVIPGVAYWMSTGGAGETAKGNLRRARIGDVCRWVKNSWENISAEIIVRSFECCGLLNNLDYNKENEELDVIDL